MNDFYSIIIDRNSEKPMYKQLGDGLRKLIEEGVIPPDTRLPAIRKMAEKLKVNTVTVVTAYKYLENCKTVYSITGSGTYVSPIPVNEIPKPVEKMNISNNNFENIKNIINFTKSSLPEELFPVEDFKKIFNDLLEKEKGGAFREEGGQGYEPLRKSLSKFCENLGIRCGKDNIQIVSGAQQGIDIVAKAIMRYGDSVIVEKPAFYGAAASFISRGGNIIEIPIEKDGMNIDILENTVRMYKPKLIYTMAYFQTPSGISYSTEKKRKLIELAEKYDLYIIEDDNMYDFNYTDCNIVPLKALDYKNRVIYIKSFSKILMPGVRTGFMVIPPRIMDSVVKAKYTSDISTSGFIQKALSVYIDEYDWKGHIETIRKYGEMKYKKTVYACNKYLDKNKFYVLKSQGGISLWIDIKINIDIDVICSELLKNGVAVSPESQFINSGKGSHIRLCFVNVSDDDIEKGIHIIGKVIEKF